MTTVTDIRQEVLQEINKLSAPQLTEVLQFIDKINFSDHKNGDQTVEKQENKRRIGILKGTFNLPLPDDFDAPLEDLAGYM